MFVYHELIACLMLFVDPLLSVDHVLFEYSVLFEYCVLFVDRALLVFWYHVLSVGRVLFEYHSYLAYSVLRAIVYANFFHASIFKPTTKLFFTVLFRCKTYPLLNRYVNVQ